MADNIEKLLKKTRLDKQLSLDDINRDLKIRKDYIKQFEKKIPELLGVYELGYLRCYAKHLGVEKEVNNYIAYLKEKTKIASKNEKVQSENSITEILKNFLAKPKITFPILGVLVLVVFFIMTNKGYIKGFDNNKETKKQISEVTTDTHDQNNNIVNISESLSIQQKGPYNYLIQGINNTSDITNIVAPVDLIRAYLYAWEDLKIDVLWHKAKQQYNYNNRLNALFAVREKLCHEITQHI